MCVFLVLLATNDRIGGLIFASLRTINMLIFLFSYSVTMIVHSWTLLLRVLLIIKHKLFLQRSNNSDLIVLLIYGSPDYKQWKNKLGINQWWMNCLRVILLLMINYYCGCTSRNIVGWYWYSSCPYDIWKYWFIVQWINSWFKPMLMPLCVEEINKSSVYKISELKFNNTEPHQCKSVPLVFCLESEGLKATVKCKSADVASVRLMRHNQISSPTAFSRQLLICGLPICQPRLYQLIPILSH